MEVDTVTRNKRRRRSLSAASSSSSGSSTSGSCSSSSLTSPPSKFHRLPSPSESSIPKDYICTLQPTCSQPGTSTSYSTIEQLERHQESFHKWICKTPIRDHDRDAIPNIKGKEKLQDQVPETFIHQKGAKRWKECNKVFPDQRLLDLHQKETHDPLIRQKKERGEKTFECFLPPDQCKRKFIDPKQRRKHLIDKHKYPQQYFFSITNHGLNELVRQDGLGISLIRPRRDFPRPQLETPTAKSTLTTPDPDTSHENGKEKETRDVEMDDLTKAMGGLESSLTFIPRGLRKKASTATERVPTNGKMDI